METIRFDYLKTFLTVARTRSFSAAAKELDPRLTSLLSHGEHAMADGRLDVAQGDFDKAVKEVNLSLTTAPDSNKANLENYVKRLQNKEDINR